MPSPSIAIASSSSAAIADVPSERLLDFCAHSPPQRSNLKSDSGAALHEFELDEIQETTALLYDETMSSNAAHVEPRAEGELSVQPKTSSSLSNGSGKHGHDIAAIHSTPEVVYEIASPVRHKKWFAYLKTRDFWIVVLLGQVLAICITSTNTFSGLLVSKGTSIPTFQILFNYVLLNLIYTTYTIYKYGFRKFLALLYKDGWRYFILAFLDVLGNYFFILAYRYATILSIQLINFWAIVVVVIMSLIFLHVRYHLTQYVGILVCVGGMGMLIASDHITGANGGNPANQLKGDLFALAGATVYGLSNTFQEFLVSKRPMYEVIGQLAFWAIFINGVVCAIFDRNSFQGSTWDGQVAGYLVGFTLILTLFYSLAPLMFRLSSAAFFNISLLTGNFWGVVIGIKVFHLHIHWMYPIAFVLIMLGFFVYFVAESVLGEAKKPWLGENQEEGVNGLGTAKRKAENPSAIV